MGYRVSGLLLGWFGFCDGRGLGWRRDFNLARHVESLLANGCGGRVGGIEVAEEVGLRDHIDRAAIAERAGELTGLQAFGDFLSLLRSADGGNRVRVDDQEVAAVRYLFVFEAGDDGFVLAEVLDSFDRGVLAVKSCHDLIPFYDDGVRKCAHVGGVGNLRSGCADDKGEIEGGNEKPIRGQG